MLNRPDDFLEPALTPAHETIAFDWRSAGISIATETLFIMGCAVMISPFMPDNLSWYYSPFLFTAVCAALSALVVLLQKYAQQSTRQLEREYQPVSKFGKWFENVGLSIIRGLVFAEVDQTTRAVLSHEGGHALTAMTLYQGMQPNITINPPAMSFVKFFRGDNHSADGLTSYNTDTLSPLGEQFGKNHSRALIAAAGSGSEIVTDVFALIAAQLVASRFPQVSISFRTSVLFSIAYIASYAFWPKDCSDKTKGNDYCVTEGDGIATPLTFSTAITFLVMLQTIMSLITWRCNRKPRVTAVPETLFATSSSDSIETEKKDRRGFDFV